MDVMWGWKGGVSAELTVAPAGRSAGRSVADVLDAWVTRSSPTWVPASHRDQSSRVARIKEDRIARLAVASVDNRGRGTLACALTR